eukprot:TRINITY_DN10197_c0_g1_i4.p1 TRINITY_DN10197_c0_g1~~TRINITY_DN10197_c0_g1_i4.p1  ORF type:complete len:1305 (+),score=448.81 TRINITY_DN10197_c0_g1_i4:91-4005(+)
MKDAIAEARYQALRAKLNDLHYYQPLSVDSSLLTETLLNDLIASTTSYKALQQKDEQQADHLTSLAAELQGFRLENPRLQAENNTLHLQLIEAGESAEKRESSARLRLRSLEDEVESAKLALQSTSNLSARWEKELDCLREEALTLLACSEVPSPVPAQVLARQPRPTRPAPHPDIEGLEAREESLKRALHVCRDQVSELEAKAAAASVRTNALEDEAAASGQRLASQGPSTASLKQKAERARLEEQSEQMRSAAAQLGQERGELEQRAKVLESQLEAARQQEERLSKEVVSLREEGLQAAAVADKLHKSSQEKANSQRRQQLEAEARSADLRKRCEATAGSNRSVAAHIAQIVREEGLQTEMQLRDMQELSNELQTLARENSEQRALLGARSEQLQRKVEEVEAENVAAATSRDAFQAEVSQAQAESEECLRQLVSSMKEIEDDIQTGAQFQQRSQSSGAHLQLLSASLSGLTGEKKMLFQHLQDKQQSLHKESLRRVELQVECKRLAAVVESLDSTRKDWAADLTRVACPGATQGRVGEKRCAIGTLRQSHTSLATAVRLEESARQACDQLRREADSEEASAEVAAAQKDALTAEVREWAQELQREQAASAQAHAAAAAAEEELLSLEAQLQSLNQAEASRQGSVSHAVKSLQEDLRSAWAERRRLEALQQEASEAARRRLQASQEGLLGLKGQLDMLLQQRDTILAETKAAEAGERRQLERASSASERASELHSRRTQLAVERAAMEQELSEAQSSMSRVEEDVAQLQASLSKAESASGAAARSKVLLAQQAELHRAEQSRASASERACSEELVASKAAVEAMSTRCSELHGDVEELVALASAAEAARSELGSQLLQRQAQLRSEEQAREQASESGGGWGEEERAAAAEVEALGKAAAALDAQRDEKQRLADTRAQELSDVKEAIVEHGRALREAQQVVDDLRASAGTQAAQLEQQRQLLTDRRALLQEVRSATERFQGESGERGTEATSIMEDLMHMTKENQDLHEEIRLLELRVKSRTSDARQQLAEQELSMQQLNAIELERDDIVRLYQQVCLQTRRQQAAIERLQADQDLARRAAGELSRELQRAQGTEEESRTRSDQLRLDMRVLEEQLADITGRISRSEEAQQEALEEDARLKGDVAAAAAACQGADEKEASQAHAFATLRLRRQQLQLALQQTRMEAAAQQRLADEAWDQVGRLESLLEGGRERLQRFAAEAQALRSCLAERGIELSTGSTSASGAGSELGTAASAEQLRQQVERRYSEVGEMDEEHHQLQAEVLRLRAEILQRKRQMATVHTK